MPQWRWKEPEKKKDDPKEELYPQIVKQGWTNITELYAAIPEGLAIYRSPETLYGNPTIAYIAVAPLDKFTWDVAGINDPKLSGTSDPLQTPSQFYASTSAVVILNGGYFFSSNGKNFNASVLVSEGETMGVNINYSSVDWVTMYYPTRGVFYQDKGAEPAVGWTYWSGGAKHYLYSEPAMNSWESEPLQVPDASFPVTASDFAPVTAIGGGPVLVKDGLIVNSWEAELLYGDGSDDKMPLAKHPRSAIGYTSDGLMILFVCEGRGMTEGVYGMTFDDEAKVMQSLGCTEALNLDGGGSSCLLVNGQETIEVSDGAQRAVSSVILIKAL